MKHAIVTLIIVILFVLVVVPLLYIALGKLKNPIDMFALNKVGNSGPITHQSNFISPNYIPASGTSGEDVNTGSDIASKTQKDAENCFSEGNITMLTEEFISLEKKEGSKLNIVNNMTGTSRYFENFYPTPATAKTVWKTGNALDVETNVLRPGCATYERNTGKLLAAFFDGGTFMQRMYGMETKDPGDFELTDKGIVNINGLAYYWFLKEEKNRIYAGPKDELSYVAYYTTAVGDIVYRTMALGSSKTYKSTRAFLNQTQVFLSGTVYGTSTAAMVQAQQAAYSTSTRP